MGTRPEAIKLAPVVKALQTLPEGFETVIVATAQHRHMLDQVLSLFQISPDIDLDLMKPDQNINELTSRVMRSMEGTLAEVDPDLVLIQGDTTTVFATSLAAFYLKVPVAHVEAGLRSRDIHNPYPEEINRRLVSVLTEIHFAPTQLARQNLLNEGVEPGKIVVTGNTVVDSMDIVLNAPFDLEQTPLADIPFEGSRVVLVTSHRRESWGRDLESICLALKDLVDRFDDLRVVYPVHLNPNVRETVNSMLGGVERIHLTEPLDYLSFINLMRRSYVILTDSGGVQEEAPAMRKPVLVLRKVTERPEASLAGMSRVVGTERVRIVEETSRLLTDRDAYRSMVEGDNPFGDGRAAERITEALGRWSRGLEPLLEDEKEFGLKRKGMLA
ncbi:MAG: UDP-N-acetylglucosamine 2-epimerase (non-hydrolyzing) [Thermodesulfobacteriota bacterium]